MPVQQPAIPCHPLNRLQCSQPAAPPHCQQASSQCPSWRTQTALPAATCMAAARRPLEPARHPTAAARRTTAAARQVRAGQRGAALAVLVLQVSCRMWPASTQPTVFQLCFSGSVLAVGAARTSFPATWPTQPLVCAPALWCRRVHAATTHDAPPAPPAPGAQRRVRHGARRWEGGGLKGSAPQQRQPVVAARCAWTSRWPGLG
jgi:hypothetical protein